MALFIFFFLILNNCLFCLLGSDENNNKVLEIKSSTITADQNVGFYRVDETLNLTCIFKNESTLPDVILEWVVPNKNFTSKNLVIHKKGTNIITLIIENLQENDSGEYKCKAVQNGLTEITSFFNSHILTESSVRIRVKNKKKECAEMMFQCSPGICIQKRYTCDGLKDCLNGEDESLSHCGPGNPCDNKLMCPDYRCIPLAWCCEYHREPNCTTKVKHSCCSHVEKLTRDVDNELGFQYEQQTFSGIEFLQTTVYTVIGCSMAFMFIGIIGVIGICRVHVRRSLLSRCPATTRNSTLGRGQNLNGNNLDVYLNRSNLGGNDLMSVNPLLVTYNINNGVQFVGRPIDPPPYCEIVTSPPKEGPPPPYASQEDLCAQGGGKAGDPKSETSPGEVEATESDALLGESGQSISVISCNAMDVVPPPPEEVLLASDSNSPEALSSCGGGESGAKEGADIEFSGDSSQCVTGVGKCGGSKNGRLNVIVVGKRDSEGPGTNLLKVQGGESSSYVSENVGGCTKSLDGDLRKKEKTFCSNHNIKF